MEKGRLTLPHFLIGANAIPRKVPTPLALFLEELILAKRITCATLSSPCLPKEKARKISVRPLLSKGHWHYQVVHHFERTVKHANLTPGEALEFLKESLALHYKQGLFCTEESDYQVLINREKKETILSLPPTPRKVETEHNRVKNYLIEEGIPLPFLVKLGIMTAEGKIVEKKRDKFRQINRFLETAKDMLVHLPKKEVWHIVDFGCGKAYLTFALYYYLHFQMGHKVVRVGVVLREELVSFCQNAADALGFSSLSFHFSSIDDYTPAVPPDMVVALHACDTATDAALQKGVEWRAAVILAAPCCQQELLSQIEHKELSPLLSYGLLKERFAALVTDAARLQLLEIVGYETQALEFVTAEATLKNLLIRAWLSPCSTKKRARALERYADFKRSLNIAPSLEERLKPSFFS